ncbi:hypothetical protein AgCh_021677 [Apium graveolens]
MRKKLLQRTSVVFDYSTWSLMAFAKVECVEREREAHFENGEREDMEVRCAYWNCDKAERCRRLAQAATNRSYSVNT